MTSNLSVIRHLDILKARTPVLNNPPVYAEPVVDDAPTINRLLSELPAHCDNYYVDEGTFEGYIEAIVMHPDFTNDKELDYRIVMFKAEPNAFTDLALRGAMIVYDWMTRSTFCY